MNFLVITFGLIKDYFLYIKYAALDLVSADMPVNWKQGDKGTVVLIPGFNEGLNFLKDIGNDLNIIGYKVIYPKSFARFTSIAKLAEKIQHEVNDLGIKNFIVVSHSKGGLVAKKMLINSPDSIDKIFSMATPWKGTYIGYLQILNLNEIKPNSGLLNELNSNSSVNNKIINIRAKFDQYMLKKQDILENGQNLEINHVGHGIQFTKEASEIIFSKLI